MTLEQAHNKMSALPAWFSDMKNRGTLRVGDWADVMVYDLDGLGLLNDKPSSPPTSPRREAAGPDAHRYTLHPGQRRGYLPGERVHRRPARQAAPQLRSDRLAANAGVSCRDDKRGRTSCPPLGEVGNVIPTARRPSVFPAKAGKTASGELPVGWIDLPSLRVGVRGFRLSPERRHLGSCP